MPIKKIIFVVHYYFCVYITNTLTLGVLW